MAVRRDALTTEDLRNARGPGRTGPHRTGPDETGNPDAWTRWSAAEVAASVAALIATLAVFTRFLAWVEARPGVVLPDPLLARLQPRDVTWITFGLIYLALGSAILALARHPRALAVAVRSYALMVLLRMMVMAVVPLDPPPGTIPLQDPLVELLGTGGHVLTRDLFFSGHTATMSLLTFNVRRPWLRVLLGACTLGVASCVLLQAVHYTVDVLAAPAFAYAAYRVALATTPARRRGGGAGGAHLDGDG